MDAAAIVYLTILVSLGVNIGLLMWWAYVYPKTSAIFKCVTCLLISLWASYLLSFLSRINGVEWYRSIRNEWWWLYKNLPVAVVSVVIMAIFIHRLTENSDDV